MRTNNLYESILIVLIYVGMKPLSERDENREHHVVPFLNHNTVGMKPLSERDENDVHGCIHNWYLSAK